MRVIEVSRSLYRINTALDIPGGPSFNFNQYLVLDEDALLAGPSTGPEDCCPPL